MTSVFFNIENIFVSGIFLYFPRGGIVYGSDMALITLEKRKFPSWKLNKPAGVKIGVKRGFWGEKRVFKWHYNLIF